MAGARVVEPGDRVDLVARVERGEHGAGGGVEGVDACRGWPAVGDQEAAGGDGDAGEDHRRGQDLDAAVAVEEPPGGG